MLKTFASAGRKHRVLAIAIALAMVILPAAVFADKAGIPFSAGGMVYLTNPGNVKLIPQGSTGKVIQITKGEQIQGAITVSSPSWPGLNGQTLGVNVNHDSIVTYDVVTQPGTFNITSGNSHEDVGLYLGSQKVFDGKSSAAISGWFDSSVFAPTTCSAADNSSYALKGQIADNGTVSLKGQGNFAGQTAQGTWVAHLEARCVGYSFPILGGSINIDGLHFTNPSDDGNVQGQSNGHGNGGDNGHGQSNGNNDN